MRIHIFQHAHFESPGNIVDISKSRNHSITTTKFYEDYSFPDIDDFDLLVIMGAPMSVGDEDEYPWLIEEKKFIKYAIEVGKKILGICFGSQLIAEVLGANVYPNKQKEIGWFNIRKDKNTNSSFLIRFPDEVMAFHWHGDTYDLPQKSKPVFSSSTTENQGFTYGDKVIALQFHWEIKINNIEELIIHSGSDLVFGSFIQTKKEMITFPEIFKQSRIMMEKVIEYFEDLQILRR